MNANDLVYYHVSGNNLWSHPSTGKTSTTLGEITQTTSPNIELFSGRLAPSLEWSPGLGSPGQTKSCASSKTGALCRESSSNVSVLLSMPISALIVKTTANQIIYYTAIIYEGLHICRMNTWIAIFSILVAEYFPWFKGNWKAFSLQSVRVHAMASLA